MSKRLDRIHKDERRLVLESLYDSAKRISGPEAVRTFIDEVLTESEKMTIGRRIAIAKLTLRGLSQPEINERLHGVSPNTFGRIYKWLDDQFPGYDAALRQSRKEETDRSEKRKKPKREYVEPFSFEDLKRRYPMHFLLFTLADQLRKK